MAVVDDLERLRDAADRQEMLDCLHRYARGIDRLDGELILSAFHEDAIESHGPYRGSPAGFVDWIIEESADRAASFHHVTNHYAEIDGDVAHMEAYWMTTILRTPDADRFTLSFGRYVCRFERRDGVWKIADRVVVVEYGGEADRNSAFRLTGPDGVARTLDEVFVSGQRDKSDVSYMRPLEA